MVGKYMFFHRDLLSGYSSSSISQAEFLKEHHAVSVKWFPYIQNMPIQAPYPGDMSKIVEQGSQEILSFTEAVTGKMVRIKFFRTLEVTQRLATIWGVFVKEKEEEKGEEEKQLNLCKRNEFCVFTKNFFLIFLATPLSR